MSNDYGQIERSSLPDAVELLLASLTIYAYGPFEHPHEEVAVVDGVTVARNAQHSPQHQLSTEGLSVVNPAFYAEKKAIEKRLWKEVRRAFDRMRALDEGLCLKCRDENDQRHRRLCSGCEQKIHERVDK